MTVTPGNAELLALAARLVVASDILKRKPCEVYGLQQDCLAAAEALRLAAKPDEERVRLKNTMKRTRLFIEALAKEAEHKTGQPALGARQELDAIDRARAQRINHAQQANRRTSDGILQSPTHDGAEGAGKSYEAIKQSYRDMLAPPKPAPAREDTREKLPLNDVRSALVNAVPMAAGAIIDVMMGGKLDWRSRIDKSDFLESADWQQAVLYARAVLSLPVQPGAGEREADLLRWATSMRDWLTADGEPPSLSIPEDIVDAGDANEFTQTFDEFAKAIRAYRQAPHSSSEGGR